MRCPICKTGSPEEGTTTVTLERGNTMVVIKDVPARVCDKCGEYSLSDEVSGRVYALAGEAVMRNAELAVLRYTP